MSKTEPVSYEQIEKAFCCPKKDCFPSDLHGYLCGILCGSQHLESQNRFELVLNRLKEENLFTELNQKILGHLMITSFQQLQDPEYHFQLVLPQEEKAIKSRLKALSKWCQGFLSGLGDTGITQKNIEEKSLLEALNDIFNITATQYDSLSLEKKDNNEFYYVDLVEHVRISILLIYTENIMGKNKVI